jgi:hypothetical protein
MTRSGISRLPEHLGQTYGIEVAQVSELDVGVYPGWGGGTARTG